MAERPIKIVTREFKSTFPQYEPNRYVAFFELGGVASLGEGLGTSLDEAIGQLVRTSGGEIGITVQVPGGKLDEPQRAEGKTDSVVTSALRRLDTMDEAAFVAGTNAAVAAIKLMGLSDLLGPDGSEVLPNGDQIANARLLAAEARSSLGEVARSIGASASSSIAARRSLKGGGQED